MDGQPMDAQGRQTRPVGIQTVHGSIEGELQISAMLRTLDDLNVVSKTFVTLLKPASNQTGWTFGNDTVSINKNAILFTRELSAPPPQPGNQFRGRFSRAAVRLRVQQFDIEGFVHVPAGGSPMKRLIQDKHPFISLTSVSVIGPDTEMVLPFLAVNREQIVAAQAISQSDAADTRQEAEVGV